MKKLLYVLLSMLPFQLSAQAMTNEVRWATEFWPTFTGPQDALYNQLFSSAFQRQGMKLRVIEVPFKRSIVMAHNGTADFAGAISLDKTPSSQHVQAPFPVFSNAIAIYYKKSKFNHDDIDLELLRNRTVVSTDLIGKELNINNTQVINRKAQGFNMLVKDRADFYLDILPQLLIVVSENKGKTRNFNEVEYAYKIVGWSNWYMISPNNKKGKAVMQAYIKGTKVIYKEGLLKKLFQKAGYDVPVPIIEYMNKHQ